MVEDLHPLHAECLHLRDPDFADARQPGGGRVAGHPMDANASIMFGSWVFVQFHKL